MGKITKTASPKHEATLSPFISQFIKDASQIPLYRLATHLSSFPIHWPFPRGDLYHWIPVLNRFDDILEQFIQIYRLDQGPQTEPFTREYLLRGDKPERGTQDDALNEHGIPEDGDCILIKQVVTFTRILMERCGNRSLFSSSSHLNHLLNTSSLSLLTLTLRLSLRLAQRYSETRLRSGATFLPAINQGMLASHYQIDLAKVETLAQPFVKGLEFSKQEPGKLKDTGKGVSITPTYVADMLGLVLEQGSSDELLKIFGDPWLNYTEDQPARPNGDQARSSTIESRPRSEDVASPSDSAGSNISSTSGETGNQKLGVVAIPSEKLKKTPVFALTGETIPLLPPISRYEFFNRIRNASALIDSVHSRQELVGVRMLALANLAHIQPEHSLQHGALQYELDEPRRSQLPYQLCSLVHPPGNSPDQVPKYLQSIALLTLEALLNHRGKVNEVSAALGITVNHGVLTYASRRALKELEDPNQAEDDVDLEDIEWRESLFALLHSLPKCNHRAGEGFVAAGILNTFVATLRLRTPKAEYIHPQTLNFLDVFIFNTRDAFTALVNAGGLDVVSELLASEVAAALASASNGDGMPQDYKTPTVDYQIKFGQQQNLRAVLKVIKNMASLNGGPFDRLLRNLIESSQLLVGLKTVIINSAMFGSNIWSFAVEIFGQFIHNEPTSYAAIAEAGLTKAFLDQVTSFALLPPQDQSFDEDSHELERLEKSACSRIPPNAEAIVVVPQAFGAICLNEAGMRQFEQSGALELFFGIITMAPYVQALANASDSELDPLGAGFDELARHHPQLKPSIFRGLFELTETYGRVICANNNLSIGAKLCIRDSQNRPVPDSSLVGVDIPRYRAPDELAPRTQSASTAVDHEAEPERPDQTGAQDVNMPDVDGEQNEAHSQAFKAKSRILKAVSKSSPTSPSAGAAERTRVLATIHLGFFHHPAHIPSFAETGALEWMVEIATSLSLPHDIAHRSGFDKLSKLLHLLIEHKPHLVLPLLINRSQHALKQLKPFLEHSADTSFFRPFFIPNSVHDEDASRGQGTWTIKMLLVVQNVCRILARSFSGSGHRNSPNPFLAMNLTDLYVDLVDSLGKLQIRCVWESMLALQMIPSEWLKSRDPNQSQSSGAHGNALDVAENGLASSRPATNAESTQAAVLAATNPQNVSNGAADQPQHATSISWKSDAIEKQNFLTLRVVLHHVPVDIAGFYATLGRALLHRRMPTDAYGKQNTILVADHIAQALVSMLNYPNPSALKPRVTNYFRMISLSLVTQAQVDKKVELPDRAGPQILTLVIEQFHKAGGVGAIGATMQKLFEDNLTDKPEDHQDSKTQGIHFAVQALQLALKFLTQVTNYKSVNDAHQTGLLSAHPRTLPGESKYDLFSLGQFLVELRYQALQALLPLWNSDGIGKARPAVIRPMCSIVQNILDCSGENGAFQRKDKPSRKSKPERKQWKMRNADRLATLKERGFDQALAREALYRCNENVNPAGEYCEARKRNSSLPSFPIPPNDDIQASVDTSSNPADNSGVQRHINGSPAAADPGTSNDELFNQFLHDDTTAFSPDGRETDPTPTTDLGTLPLETSSALPSAPPSNDSSSASISHIAKADGPGMLTVEDLDDARGEVRRALVERCLTILDCFDDLSFELADLIVSGTGKASDPSAMRQDVSETLIESLISIKESGALEQESKKITACAHLLGVILQDRDFFNSGRENLQENFSGLIDFLVVSPENPASKTQEWIGPILLILERILSEDAQPRQIEWTFQSSETGKIDESPADLTAPLVSFDRKEALFNKIVDMLPRIGKDAALGLAVVRILVSLTRNPELATTLGHKRNMQRLFVAVKQLCGIAEEKFHAAFMLVLRHVVEDEVIVRDIMRNDIREFFIRQPRQTDTTTFTRSLHHDILRAPDTFVAVTNELLMLPRFDRSQSPQVLMLKEHAAEDKQLETSTPIQQPGSERPKSATAKDPSASEEQDSGDKNKPSSEVKAPILDHPDTVTQFLLSELLAYKDVEDKDSKAPSRSKDSSEAVQNPQQDVEMSSDRTRTQENTNATLPSDSKVKAPFKAEDHPIYVYRCFILQCLTELLQSYNRSKLTFINFSRKAEPATMMPSKPRSGVLSYLLNGLIPTGSIQHPNSDESRQRANTSGWAAHVIVALCSCTPEKGSIKSRDSNDVDAEPELVFVRKFVLEQALKAFKDTNVTAEPSENAYSRYLGLADVFSRLLAGKPSPDQGRYGRSDHHDNLVPSQKQIAKIMFEKNFIASLTSSVSEIDLNFPGANRVVKYILRPLKLLTHTAIELSQTSDASTSPGQSDSDEISSATSVSDHGEGREETPDLFRNSTLGMFEPGRENQSSSESEEEDNDDDDEEMYGETFADDMDYDEEGLHHPGDVVSDEDEEMEGVGPMEGLSGEMGMELEVNLNGEGNSEDLSGHSEDEDEESDSDNDEQMEAMEEVTGDDENHSLDEPGPDDDEEWEDEEAEFENDGEQGEDLDMGEGPLESANESQSDSAMPPFDAAGLPNPADVFGDDVAIEEGDHDGPGDDESDEDDGEEEDEDYEEEEIGFEGPEYDDLEDDSDMPPFVWPPPRRRHSHHHRHHWTPMLHTQERLIVPGFRSSRPTTAPRPIDDGSNPLLSRGPQRNTGENFQSAARQGAMRRMQLDLDIGMPGGPGGGPIPPELRNLATSGDPSENFPGLPPNAVSSLLNMLGGPHLNLGPHHHHGGLAFTMPRAIPSGGFHIHTSEGPPAHRIQELHVGRDDPSAAVTFQPASTDRRWQEAARMIFGPSFIEKSQRVINSILKLLVPPALEAEKRRKAEEEEHKRKLEEKRAKEKAEKEAKEHQEQEEREAEKARVAAENAQAEADAEAERSRAAGTQANNEAGAAETDAEQPADQGEAMEGVEQTQAPQDTAEAETAAEPSEPRQRVMTSIRGNELDITDLGIDLTYLEALPEEMREEVIMQQYAEQRSNAAAAGEEPSAINSEFLNALPPDIRAELLQQEAQDRRRRERDEARRRAQESGVPAQPEEIDPASFIASLDPVLRQQVLAESDEDMLAALPADIAAEARALGGHHRRRAIDPTQMLGVSRRAGDPFPRHRSDDNRSQRRPIVQMLDKAGVATLLRLMFINVSGVSRTSLNGILMNACGNRQTRGEVVNGLLSILQDGSADVNAVERCFNQLTLRAKQSAVPKAPQSIKTKTLSSPSSGDASPQMVIGQCLGALVFLTQSILHIPHFFLTEHEVVGAPKTKTKGKGKAKETKASKYPFIALLSLLDRDLVVNNAGNMEQLAGLMASITQPLNGILKRDKEKAQDDGAQRDPAAQSSSNVQAEPTTDEPRHEGGQGAVGPQTDQAEPPQPNAGSAVPSVSQDVSTPPQPEATTSAQESSSERPGTDGKEQKKDELKKPRALEAPEVPPETLRPVINILTARECSSKAFRDTLSTITNLCAIQGAKDTFVEELIQQARRLGQRVQSSLDQLTESLKGVENEMQAQSIALANFSPNDSDQIKMNRVLTALDYLFETSSTSSAAAKESNSNSEQRSETLTKFYEDASFMELWHRLSACLTATKQTESNYFFNVATILLPLIEALMVVCKRIPLKDPHSSKPLRPELTSPQAPPSGMRGVFFTFTNRHRKILNDLVRHSPKLMSGSFSVMVKNSSVLEFDNKRNFFTRRLHHRSADMRHYPHPSLQLNVRRDHVFLDSYKCLHYRTPEEIKYGRFNIRFRNEEGVDAGGVTREWFQVLARQMFNPDYALFNPVASDRTTFHPNNLSSINEQHLEFFKFIGRIIGKALYENRVLDCHFSRALYKRILGQPVSMKDMETVDLEYSKNMEWMLKNDITDIITETFSVAQDNFGVTEIVDLCDNGRNIPVTEENKEEYVRLVIEYRLTGSVQKQLESFLKGFHDIVPPELISIFDEGELELLISGMPDVDVDDWKANTEYHNYNASSPQIQWFWRAVRSFDKEERARLLQFVTGTGKVPLNGFKELEGMNGFTRFSIHKDYAKDRLPSSHTCFNQLDLPEYDNFEALRKAVYTAMTTGNEYFGYA